MSTRQTKIGVLVSLAVIQLITAASLQAQELKLGELKLMYTEDEIPITSTR